MIDTNGKKMLVIHWTKHNRTGDILKNGIRPSCRQRRPGGEPLAHSLAPVGDAVKQSVAEVPSVVGTAEPFRGSLVNVKGVYVFPFTRNKVIQTHWKRFLKRDVKTRKLQRFCLPFSSR